MKIYSSEDIKRKMNRRRRIRAVFQAIFYVFLIFLTVCTASILYQKVVEKSDHVNLFGYKPYIVISGSMDPIIKIGDMLIVKKLPDDQLAVDDIVTFADEGGVVVTHRIVDILIKDGQRYFQTKGDVNNTNDVGLTPGADIIGKYCFKIEQGGFYLKEIMSLRGLMCLELVVVVIYIGMSRKSDRRMARHEIRKRYEKQNNS